VTHEFDWDDETYSADLNEIAAQDIRLVAESSDCDSRNFLHLISVLRIPAQALILLID
jgi:hypothetical protein